MIEIWITFHTLLFIHSVENMPYSLLTDNLYTHYHLFNVYFRHNMTYYHNLLPKHTSLCGILLPILIQSKGTELP